MRIIGLILLLLMNSISLPLQAIPGDHIPTSVADSRTHNMTQQQDHHSEAASVPCSMSSVNYTDGTMAECDMSSKQKCNTTTVVPFLMVNPLIVFNAKEDPDFLHLSFIPETNQDSPYRPPLIS